MQAKSPLLRGVLAALALAAALPATAQFRADPNASTLYGRPNWNYVGGGYTWQRLDVGALGDCKQDGLYFEGSLLINEQIFVQADVSDVNGDFCGSTNYAVGAGITADYGSASVIYGVGQLIMRDYGGDSDPGVGINGGIRTMVRQGFELNAFAGFEKVDEADQLFIGGGINYWITPEISLTGAININDEGSEGFSFGGRYNF